MKNTSTQVLYHRGQQPIEDVTILRPTTRYDDYFITDVNREIDRDHVDRIAEYAYFVNLLDLFPIVCDGENVIQDGQHKTEVGRLLDVPIYVLNRDNIRVSDIAKSNSVTRPYSDKDCLYTYAKMGLKPYVYFRKFMEMYPHMAIGFVIKLLSDEQATVARQSFFSGTYTISRHEYGNRVANMIRDFESINGVKSSTRYRDVLAKLAMSKDYDHSRMISRAKAAPLRIVKATTISEAFRVLSELYNYNVTKKNRATLSMTADRVYDSDTIPVTSDFDVGIRIVEPNKAVQVRKSTNLDRFSPHPHARQIDNASTFSLTNAIKEKNLLDCFPIIVDEKKVVLDGQRRLVAAKRLGLPIYYIQADDVAMGMIVSASIKKKSWGMRDYLSSYIKLGRADYINLNVYLERYSDIKLNVAIFANTDFLVYEGQVTQKFQDGKFLFSKPGRGKKFAEVLSGILPDRLRVNHRIQRILLEMLGSKDFSADEFFKKAKLCLRKFEDVHVPDNESALDVITEIYNFRRRNKVVLVRPNAEEYIEKYD